MRRVILLLLVLLVATLPAAAGFPTVAATNGGNSGANVTSHTVNLPTGISSGDLIIVMFSNDGDATVTFPSGWTNQLFSTASGTFNRFTVNYRIADGTEGSTITVTTSASEGSAHTTYRITGYTGTPEASTPATSGGSTTPDPSSLTPSWGADDTLWLAVQGNNGNVSVTAYPTNYSNGINNRWASTNGVGVGSAERTLNAASENPGTFTISASNSWVAATIGVRGTASTDQPPLPRRVITRHVWPVPAPRVGSN